MGFIYCPTCGQQVSDQAAQCPNCGTEIAGNMYKNQQQYGQQPYYPPQKSNNTLLYVIIGLLAGVLIGGLVLFFVNQNNKNERAISQMKRKQELLEKKNEKLQTEVDEAKTEAEAAKNKKQTVVVTQGAVNGAAHRAVSAGGGTPKIVVNGTGVRLRFAPSLSAGYLTWSNGQTRSVPKGTRLTYGGWENGDWYKVIYQGIEFYISKEYSYMIY